MPPEAAPSVQPQYDRAATLRHLQEDRLRKAQEQAQVQLQAKATPSSAAEALFGQPTPEQQQKIQIAVEARTVLEAPVMDTSSEVFQYLDGWADKLIAGYDWEMGLEFANTVPDLFLAMAETSGHPPRLDKYKDAIVDKLRAAKATKEQIDKFTGTWQGMIGEMAVRDELSDFGDNKLFSTEHLSKTDLDAKGLDALYFRYAGIREDKNGNQYHAVEMIGVQAKCRLSLSKMLVADCNTATGADVVRNHLRNKCHKQGWEAEAYVKRVTRNFNSLVVGFQQTADDAFKEDPNNTGGIPVRVEGHYIHMEVPLSTIDQRTGQFKPENVGLIKDQAIPALLGSEDQAKIPVWRQ